VGPRGEFRPRQTRQLPRAVDLKGRFFVSCCGKMLKKSYILNFIIDAKFSIYSNIKYLLYLSWDWDAWCLTQPGG
jgi:hypothetical protein